MSLDMLVKRMFLILHDSFTGEPCIGPELLRCGLVAAEIADLIMSRRLGMENDRIVVAETRAVGVDEIDAFVIESMRRQSGAHTVRSWVDALAEMLYELVARGLVQDGVVRREQGGRRLLRRQPDRFAAVDLVRAAGPRVRLEHMLRTPGDFDEPGAVIAAILGAMQVERVLDVDGDRATVRNGIAAASDLLTIDLRSMVAGVSKAALGIIAPR